MSRVSILAMLLASSAVPAHAAAPAQIPDFKAGASSSGWIGFTPYTNLGIYLPVKINGHDTMAWLWGGPSSIDKGFAQSIGIAAEPEAAGSLSGVEVQIGDLTLRNASAKPGDLQAEAYVRIIGQPLPFSLGEAIFDQLAVDIDFAHHRVAFRDPKKATKPAGATEIPLIQLEDERVVPLSVDGAAPAQFELELGNMNGPLMVSPAYAQAHKLLDGHPVSERLSGRYSEKVVSLDHLGFAGVDFPNAPIAIIPDPEVPPASIAGGVGLPLLARFSRLVIDYSHNRLYAVPDKAKARMPIEKDRIGLVLAKKDSDFGVAFVAPNSPAEAAGFKKGDKIALIDGKPFDGWPAPAIVKFQMADAGTTHAFTMADGSVRQVRAVDFF
jgi:hypothetical protein